MSDFLRKWLLTCDYAVKNVNFEKMKNDTAKDLPKDQVCKISAKSDHCIVEVSNQQPTPKCLDGHINDDKTFGAVGTAKKMTSSSFLFYHQQQRPI